VCGRYTVFDEQDIVEMKKIIDEVERRFTPQPAEAQLSFLQDPGESFSPIKKGELRPGDNAPVLFPRPEGRPGWIPVPMRWGFPRYGEKSGLIFNARCETVWQLPTFRRSVAERRVVVPSTGFYEWDHHDPEKKRYLFRVRGSRMLYMAGIFNLFSDGNSEYLAFAILTRPANAVMEPIHDRMPVIIERQNIETWLYEDRAVNRLIHTPVDLLAYRA